MTTFKRVDTDADRTLEGEEQERWLRHVSDYVWVSVLHRLTGFGWWEWETAICRRDGCTDECNIVSGDRRDELADLSEDELFLWLEDHRDQLNSFDSIMRDLKAATERDDR